MEGAILKALTVTLAITGLMLAVAMPVAADDAAPFHGDYSGKFNINFGGCSNGDSRLQFSGPGHATHVGRSTVTGNSCLRPDPDPARANCFIIVRDDTFIKNRDGEVIHFRNQGEDCLTASGQINGGGPYTIVGGTGEFSGASGTGMVKITAQVTASQPGGVSGTFGPLTFDGTISDPS